MTRHHSETHNTGRIGWLRAAVLGANDGLLSTASLVIGVASAAAGQRQILVTGLAGLVAGAMSMAAGEYVSVSSQADAERADLALERDELHADPDGEQLELTNIYIDRGLTPDLARQVAEQLTAHNALKAHARDELGLTEMSAARPIQAAAASAASFASGALLPLLAALLSPAGVTPWSVGIVSLLGLALLGALGARAGQAPMLKPVVRVVSWGAAAMGVTALAGLLFGARG